MAASREKFLTHESREPQGVRRPILASWQRSQDWRVAADRIEMSYQPDGHLDTRLSRIALPVLKTLREHLDGQSVSVILTDATGLVLNRMTGDIDFERHLDRVLLAPGFNYAEKFVGTNGIGTALEIGGPAHVFGHEHYAENLEDLACAGVPIHDPISSRLVGAVDLTCWRKDAGALLLTLAKTTAEQIRQSLLADAASTELRLVQEYLRTCRRNPGIVLALNNEVAMLNGFARASLGSADQAALFAYAAESMTLARHSSVTLELPSGQRAKLCCRPLRRDDLSAGIVAHATLERAPATAPHAQTAGPAPLPGLVGSGPVWLSACHEVERAFCAGEWLAVEGETGVGKLAVLTAVQLRRQPIGRFVVLDAAEAGGDGHWLAHAQRAIDNDADSVVIRHVDTLDTAGLRALKATLHAARVSARERPLWAAVTLAHPHEALEQAQLLQLFPTTVTLPPLRMHREDLQALVSLFLSRLARGGHLVCSPEAMHVLMRMELPSNAEQIHQILRVVMKHRRTGRIEPEDLPPQAHTMSRRVLTPLEVMERDAIVTCLSDSHGNKANAARALGVSRATIYRKIHDYGIVSPS